MCVARVFYTICKRGALLRQVPRLVLQSVNGAVWFLF